MTYGPLTVERHRALQAHGLDLHVFVRGVDVTHRCRYVDDTPGQQVAELFRHTARGHCHLDEDGCPAIEVCEADIEVRPEVLEP